MNIYISSLKKLGICLIAAAVLDAAVELTACSMVSFADPELLLMLQTPAGIIAKDLIGLTVGLISLCVCRMKIESKWPVLTGLIMTLVTAAVILMTMRGSFQRRINGLVDITWILMILTVYTTWELGRAEREWWEVSARDPSELVLRLQVGSQWFDPFEIGPNLVLNRDIAAVIDRYVLTLTIEKPLIITIQCPEQISEAMGDTFAEVLKSYYDGEERRVASYISRRFDRMMTLVIISTVCIMAGANIFMGDSANLVQTALCAFLGFTFAQLGMTFYEISDGHKDLIRMHIAGTAKIEFL